MSLRQVRIFLTRRRPRLRNNPPMKAQKRAKTSLGGSEKSVATALVSSPHDLLQLGGDMSPAFFLRAAVRVLLLEGHVSSIFTKPNAT